MSTSTAAVESGAIITYLYAFSGEWGSTRASNATHTNTNTDADTSLASPRLVHRHTSTATQTERAKSAYVGERAGGKKDGAQ